MSTATNKATVRKRAGVIIADAVLKATAAHYAIAVSDLTRACRKTSLVRARRTGYRAAQLLGASLTATGIAWHRDHTTVLHGLQQSCNEFEAMQIAYAVAPRIGRT